MGGAAGGADRCRGAYFTRRAQAAGLVTGALSLATLAELHGADPALWRNLTGRALPLVITAAAAGVAVVAPLGAGRPRGLRALAALRASAGVWGWGVAQHTAPLPRPPGTPSN